MYPPWCRAPGDREGTIHPFGARQGGRHRRGRNLYDPGMVRSRARARAVAAAALLLSLAACTGGKDKNLPAGPDLMRGAAGAMKAVQSTRFAIDVSGNAGHIPFRRAE